jgi:chemosensory pili system protein ChpA (sensor histidine kinase/response regulator)
LSRSVIASEQAIEDALGVDVRAAGPGEAGGPDESVGQGRADEPAAAAVADTAAAVADTAAADAAAADTAAADAAAADAAAADAAARQKPQEPGEVSDEKL